MIPELVHSMSSLHAPIKAEELPLKKIFSSDYLFVIPRFQRPFSWKQDNFEALFTDIYEAMNETPTGAYFLGSMVLWNEEGNTYNVIDGQQRLATLTILLAVLRDYIKDEKYKNSLHKAIFQEKDPLLQTPPIERLRPWEELRDVFEKYIYSTGGTEKLLKDFEGGRIRYIDEEDPIYHVKEAVETFYRLIKNSIPSDQRERELERYASYLFNNVYVVVIKTATFGSAIRLFNVLNTRGLPLSSIDILKSLNLEAIGDRALRDRYADKWIELEKEMGREKLESLLSYVRLIYAKEKARRTLHEEFERLYNSGKLSKGKDFIDLIREYAEIYMSKIIAPELEAGGSETINRYKALLSIMRRYLPFSEWIPPLMAFYRKFYKDDLLIDFLLKLEKKAVIEWIAGFTATERITSFSRVIRLIDATENPSEVVEKLLAYRPIMRDRGRIIDYSNKEMLEKLLEEILDREDFYRLKGGKLAKYLLLRLDIEKWDLASVAPEHTGIITVEHILPRKPAKDSEWTRKFDEETRKRWVDRLGNLVLLSGPRNSRAANYDFGRKVKIYFSKKWTPFKITQEMRDYKDWDLQALKRRHEKLKQELKNVYLS